jgi:DNA modification methylase
MAKRNGKARPWPADAIHKWPISRLLAYEKNARQHSDAQIATIVASIKEWGWTMPILVDEDGLIIAGHGRLAAAQQLGLKAVPVIIARGLTEVQKRAYRLADNAIPEQATWNLPLLKMELNDIASLGYDMPLLGFEEYQLVQFMASPPDPDAEIAPEPPVNPVTRRGDIWLLDKHRVMCGDATSGSDVAACLGKARPHLLCSDPPYGVDYDPAWRDGDANGKGKVGGGAGKNRGRVQNDTRADWSEAWALAPSDVAYVWHGGLSSALVAGGLEAAGFEIRSQIIWNKDRTIIGRGNFHWKHEPCWYAVRAGRTAHWQGDRTQGTVWDIGRSPNETGHGTQKPIECMKRPILNNSRPGEAVYDPFVGSGTTIIAAEMTKRPCLAIDIDPIYIDVAVERWAKFAGKTPILESTGQTFAEVQESRYDGKADFAGSIKDGLAAVRARQARGGAGWAPGASKPQRKKAPRRAPSVAAKAKPAGHAAQ